MLYSRFFVIEPDKDSVRDSKEKIRIFLKSSVGLQVKEVSPSTYFQRHKGVVKMEIHKSIMPYVTDKCLTS